MFEQWSNRGGGPAEWPPIRPKERPVEHAAARRRPAYETGMPAEAVPRGAAPAPASRVQEPPGRAEQVRGAHPHAAEPPGPSRLPPPRRMPERHSVRDQILRALRGALVTGDLEPGVVYSAPVLAERFGVSATPVREAMQLLAREGAVEAVPNRGFRVAERSRRDRAELAEVRALIEVPVVLRLARTVPPSRWEQLRPLSEATVAAAPLGDRGGYAEADRAFHRALLEVSGNRQLVAVAEELHRRAQWPVAEDHARSGGEPRGIRAELVAD